MTVKVQNAMDVIITLLYAPGFTGKCAESVRGITLMQKLLFLLSKSIMFTKQVQNLNFKPNNFGPCSIEVYDFIETLKEWNLIDVKIDKATSKAETGDYDACIVEINSDANDNDKELEVYGLNDDGKSVGKELFESLTDKQRDFLIELKEKYNGKPLYRVLHYVYSKYPDTTSKSIIRNKVMGVQQ